MISRVMDYISKYDIIRPQDTVIAAVSGGADSVCLFLVLNELRKQLDFELEVIHVEHGIRGEESKSDAEFTSSLCLKHNVMCKIVNVDVPSFAKEQGLGLEEAARILRYEILLEHAKERGAKIALAHHQEDNAETVLFQMVRGSGIHGLSGMAPVRKDDSGVEYIRPLLCVSRDEIEEYLDEKNQPYCTDKTNSDVNYDRNRIRHNILPELKKVNDQATTHINMTAEKLALIENYMGLQVKSAVDEMVDCQDGRYCIHIEKLVSLHPAIKSECLLEIIGMAAGRKKDIAAVHVNQLIELADMQSGKKIMLPYSLEAVREYDKIVIGKVAETKLLESGHQVFKEQLPVTINLGNTSEKLEIRVFDFDGDFDKIPQKAYTKWVDYDKIKDGFCIRKREKGDFFINDSKGHRKKLKEFFIDAKIPVSEREDIWLMAVDQEVIIVLGYRINEAYKVSSDTKKIMEVTYIGRK